MFFVLGKARAELKWADGKALKAELEMAVSLSHKL